MALNLALLAFNSGELTPYLRHRTDFDKQPSGAELMENFIAMPFGGVRKRPGSMWNCKLAGPTRLEAFQFNAQVSYVLAFTSTALTVFRPDGSVAATLSGSFGDPFLLQFAQINDVIFATSRTMKPQRIERVADDHWVMEDIPWAYQPFLTENLDETKIYTVATATTPAIWVSGVAYSVGTVVTDGGSTYFCTVAHTSNSDREPGVGDVWQSFWRIYVIPAGGTGLISGPAFDPAQVGSLFQISQRRAQDQFETKLKLVAITNGQKSNPLIVIGKWSFMTYGTWGGTVNIERSRDNGFTWESDYRTYESAGDFNAIASGDEDTRVLMRISWVFTGTGTSGTGQRAVLTSEEAYLTSRIRITGFPTPGVYTTASFEAVDAADLGGTDIWREGAFSDYQGYPAAIAVHERRLMFAGTVRHPVSIWTSKTDDLLNYEPGSTEDDASIFITLAATRQDPIRWIASQRRLVVGTAGSEWVFGSESSDAPLSPTNLMVRQYTFYGSAALPAMTLHEGVYFIERQGRRLRELAYQLEQETYEAADLTRLAEHITAGGMVQMAWQGNREPALWAVRADGTLLNFTYIRTERVSAWSRHTTQGGAFRSVAVLRNNEDDDVVFTVVERGGDYHLEHFAPSQQATQEAGNLVDSFYLDGGVVAATDGTNHVTVPEHLDGQMVAVLADGLAMTLPVNDSKVLMPAAFTKVAVGFPVVSRLITLPPDMQTQQGFTHALTKRANALKLSLYQSFGGRVIYEGGSSTISTTSAATDLFSPPPLATGWYEVTLRGGYAADMQFEIRHETPHPFTLRTVAVRWNTSEQT